MQLVDGNRICEMLAISRQTLDKRIADGTVLMIPLGGVLRFDPEEVLENLKKQRDTSKYKTGDSPRVEPGEFRDGDGGFTPLTQNG